MPDDQIQTPSPPGTGDEQAANQASQDRIERIVSRHGGDPSSVPAIPEPRQAGPPGGGESQGSSFEEAEERRKQSAREGFMQRAAKRQRIADLEARNDQLERLIEETLTAVQSQRELLAPKTPEPQPPDFDADPKAWYEWQNEQPRKGLLGELAPVLDHFKNQSQQFEQQQRAEAAFRERAARMAQRKDLVQFAEDEYLQTEQGQGYMDRFNEYGQHLLGYYEALGHQNPPAMVGMHLHGMVELALQNGWNPAEYVDREMRYRGITGQGTSEQNPTPRRQAQRQQSESAALAAAAKSGLASSLSQGGSGKAPAAGIASLKSKPNVTVAEMKAALAKMPPGSQRSRLMALREATRRTG